MRDLLTRSADVWFRVLRAFEGDPRRVELATSLLVRLTIGGFCVLIGSTWPLWVPGGDFPRVPLVGWAASLPDWTEWTALAGFGVTAVVTLIGGKQLGGRWSALITVLAIGLLALADQHRLQPWAYQLGVLFAGLSAAESVALARVLVASIYFYSALSKLDRSFFDSGGGQIVDGLLRSLGLAGHVGADGRTALAGVFAIGELLVAVGLCWRRSRKFAWPASILMHILLLIALGPRGAENKSSVLLWNAYFILQNVVLFGLAGELPADSTAVAAQPGGRSDWGRWALRGLVAFVIVFPLTEPFGVCDVWPAWAVYATGPERLRVFIPAADRDRLPAEVRKYLQAPRFEDDRGLLRIDRWSLDACGAPLYPQNRFRLGIALALGERSGLSDAMLVEIESAANRFTGERTSRQLQGRAAIVAELERFWLNGFPRADRPPSHAPVGAGD